MAQTEIPRAWRESVSLILRKGTKGKEIIWTFDALQDFEESFLGAWPYEAHDAIRNFLTNGQPTGCPVLMERPAGTTFEFFFTFKKTKAYGKVLLKADGKSIMIFSAHLPRKTKLSCE